MVVVTEDETLRLQGLPGDRREEPGAPAHGKDLLSVDRLGPDFRRGERRRHPAGSRHRAPARGKPRRGAGHGGEDSGARGGFSHRLCQRNTLPSARRRGPGCSRRRSSERCTEIGGSSAACSPNIEMALAETDFQIARHYAERLYAILLTINGIPSGLRNTERSCIISLTGTLGRSGVLEEAGSSGRANADCQGHPRTASGFLLQL